MRLAFIDPEPPSPTGGGIRTYIRLAARLCARRGMDVRIYSHNPAAYAGIDARPIGRKPCLPRGWRGLAYRFCHAEAVAFEHACWLAEELRDNPVDFAEFADFQGYAYYALRDRTLRSRLSLRVHTPLYLVYAETGKRWTLAFPWLRLRERRCLRRAAWITAPSGEFVEEKLPWLRNYRVIPNPPPSFSKSEHRKRESGEFRIAFLGRVEPRKGALELLQAFLTLAEGHSGAALSFIGDIADPEYHRAMRARLEKAPENARARVRWIPGQTGDKTALLASYSCLVIPSRWENSPYVFWEGMAAGLPCLGTDTGEMKRARERLGTPPINPGDAASLAEGLLALISFPELEAGIVARQFAYLEDIASAAEALPEFYAQCAQTHSASA